LENNFYNYIDRNADNYLLFLSSRPVKGRPKILNEERKERR
jgi:hypothetical protein